MLSRLRQIFAAPVPALTAAIPLGQRVYAIGDIHGRADLFAALIEAIDQNDAARGSVQTTIILLGDLIDRGPDSAGVISLARDWQVRRTVRILMGNHEEMFLAALKKADVMRSFLRFGGRETLLSYPIDPIGYASADIDEVIELANAAIPAGDLAFIRGFEDQVSIGDYHFVHAGVRPDQPLDAQRIGDLRWIREPFLDHSGDFGAVVVHGHSISETAEFRSNRIGIDTGAYQSGRLTALGLEGTSRWLITATELDGTVRVIEGE
jgi:serine/threonine protein phosphatase 1